MLRLEERDRPEPRPGEVRIRIRAVEVTKGDCELRSFQFPVKWFAWALRLAWGVRRPRVSRRVLGGYFAGEVDACGAGVTRFAVGDRVMGCGQLRLGAYAEWATFPESYAIARLAGHVGFAEAAAALLGGLNALHFLNRGGVSAGDQLLINGAGGSIGLLAIQMAKARGAIVTAVDKAAKADLVQRAGADGFIDYTQETLGADARRWDVMLNMAVGVRLADCLKLVQSGGRVMLGNPCFADLLRAGFGRPADGKRAFAAFARESQGELEVVAAMLADGTLKPIVDRVLSLEQAADAHRRVEHEERLGAVVLSPDR